MRWFVLQLNQLCVPKLEPEATRQNHERLFSPSDLFAVLYGKTHLRQAKRETHVSQGNTKFMAAENQTGLLSQYIMKLLRSLNCSINRVWIRGTIEITRTR